MRSAKAICVDYERIYASGESHQQERWTHICVVQFFGIPRSRAVSLERIGRKSSARKGLKNQVSGSSRG